MTPDVERRAERALETPVARSVVKAELRRRPREDEMPQPRDWNRARPHMFPEVTR